MKTKINGNEIKITPKNLNFGFCVFEILRYV